jgi:hypothetical protein
MKSSNQKPQAPKNKTKHQNKNFLCFGRKEENNKGPNNSPL